VNIERVLISKVIPWDKNPRGIKTKDFERLKKQIKKLGEYKPLIAYRENGHYVVLGGNMRLRAYQELGIQEVEVSVIKPKTEAQKIEYALSDNDRVGYYEEEALAELVYPHIKDIDLGEYKVDLGEPIDLKQVVERYGPDIDDGADEVPEVDDTPAVTRTGDLFTLGRHRVMCGDSTKAEDVAWLMRGEKAQLLLTDPPYGISVVREIGTIRGAKEFGKVRHGRVRQPGGKAKGVLGGKGIVEPRLYRPVIGDDEPFDPAFLMNLAPVKILFGANHYASRLPDAAGWLVWDKGVGADTSFSGCELAWTNKGEHIRKYEYRWSGMVRAGSRKDELVDRIHPTQKPVGLFAKILGDFSGDPVLDLFLGSGTTLIAAEKLDRVCYGMEIDPKYCDIIIKRYADYVGVSEDSVRVTREKCPNSAPRGPRSGKRGQARLIPQRAGKRAKNG